MTKHPLVWKLYAFVLIVGLQPSFAEYEHHFLRKCLGVTRGEQDLISLGATLFVVAAVVLY